MKLRHSIVPLSLIAAATVGFAFAPARRIREIREHEVVQPDSRSADETRRTEVTVKAGPEVRSVPENPAPRDLRIPRNPTAAGLFDRLLPFLDDDQLHSAIFSTVLWGGGQRYLPLILDLFQESHDPDLLGFCAHLLTCVESDNEELVDRLLGAFEAERHVPRRNALAKAVGSLDKVARARRIVESLLVSGDATGMTSALRNFDVGDVPEDEQEPWIERLRQIAISGEPSSLRSAAVEAVSSDRTPSGVRFLLDRLRHESDAEVLAQAARGLPTLEDELSSFAPDALSLLLSIARDSRIVFATRRSSAFAIERILANDPELPVADEDRALVKELAKRKTK